MNIRKGDEVAFIRAEAAISNHACAAFGFDFINSIIFGNCKYQKGVVTKIKTRNLFFFKLKKPVYLIDDYYIARNVKPVVRLKYYKWVSPCSTIYELSLN